MKHIGKFLFQRVVLVALSILLQLALFVSIVTWLSEYRYWVRVLMTAVFYTPLLAASFRFIPRCFLQTALACR